MTTISGSAIAAEVDARMASDFPASRTAIAPYHLAVVTGIANAINAAGGLGGGSGNALLHGSGAPSSGTGSNGDFYIDTSAYDLYGPKAAGSWPAGVSIIGPAGATGANGTNGTNGVDGADGADGANGADGKTILYGTAAPTTEGVDGDFYIRTTTSFLYGPKASGTWPSGTSLVGPTGAAGSPGADGADGATGPTGPAGPAPSGTGVVLVSGGVASAGTVNLAGGSSYVTGTLPTANQASQSMGGDCSGTTASCTVGKLNGIAASGTPTTGNGLHATSSSACAWSALNLAGGSDYVTGTLPVGNGGTGISSLGAGIATFLGTPSGTNLASALTSALPLSKGGTGLTAVPGSSGEIIFNSSSAYGAATNVKAGSGFLSVGASPSSAGSYRAGNNVAALTASDGAGGIINLVSTDASANCIIGADPAGAIAQVNNTYIYSGNTIYLAIGGTAIVGVDGSSIQISKPLYGSAGNSSPWAGLNGMAVKNLATQTYTLATSEYCMSIIKITGTGANTIKLPAVTDGQAYMKYIWNAGASTLAVQDTNSVAMSGTLAAGTGAWVLFAGSAVKRLHTGFTVA